MTKLRNATMISGGVAGGFVIFMIGVGVGMYPTEVNGKVSLPQATTTITTDMRVDPPTPLPEATKTIQLPRATTTKTLPQATKTITKKVPQATTEDDPGFDCRTQGNRICGPGLAIPAGCYRGGVRVIAWSNYSHPQLDPLWGQVKSPC
jgi:hypothetical protein